MKRKEPDMVHLRLVAGSGFLQPDWYLDQHPDVATLGMDPAEHYLRYGAALGRDPGLGFSTRHYLGHEGVAQTGLNPLVHYALHGRKAGLSPRSNDPDPVRRAQARIDLIRGKMMSLGFTETPLAELSLIRQTSPLPAERAMAARQLAVWHMRERSEEGTRAALALLAAARRDAPDHEFRCKLVKAELLCHWFLGQAEDARAAYERAALAGEATADAMLAWANFQPTPDARVAWINEVLRLYDVPPVALLPGAAAFAYDRLTVTRPLPRVADGPKVTVLLAAYDAAAMIGTALRSLRDQTWRNIEVIVIDDHSPTGDMAAVVERFAQEDPRFRLVRMSANAGAYVARNRGLVEATGAYVTLHDADDWSHPLKIETQVRFLEANPAIMACTSEQARTLDDLTFAQLRGGAPFITFNTSSLMFRREPVRVALGYWDTVRFGADSEFIRRMQKLWGRAAGWTRLVTGPLSFQRDARSSITSDPITGLEWGHHYYGVRKEYFDAQRHHHATAPTLRYDGNPRRRPFPVPPMMLPERGDGRECPVFDVVFFGDFRRVTPEVARLVEEVAALRDAGKRVGLVEAPSYDEAAPVETPMCANLRALVDGERVRTLVYGEEARTRALVAARNGGSLDGLRLLPRIHVLGADALPGQPASRYA